MTSYRLLGPLEVERAGRPVELGALKQRAVLSVLLLDAGRVVSTDRLVDAVWGNDQPSSVAASLQAYISNLRRVLRDDERATSPIVRKGAGYLIDITADETDLARFVSLCDDAQLAVDQAHWSAAVSAAGDALALWRGPFLAEHADEDWVQVATVGLDERRRGCLQNLVVGLLGTGQVAAAVARARQLAADQPLDERACWLHAVAAYRAGRQGEALELLRDHARRLQDDLGLDPGPALRELQLAILRQDAELAGWPGSPAPALRAQEVLKAADDDRGDLVGRDSEVAVVDDALEEALRDGSRWLVLSGAAGIGKTRLAEEAARSWQRRGGRVCRTGCPDDEGVPSWWPVRQLLRDLGADPDSVLTPPAGVDADAARFAAYDKVVQVLAPVVAEAPLMLLVEDVHWADSTSLRFLTFLAETQQQEGLAVVITVRDGVGGPELSRLLAAAARHPGSRRLVVPPLTDQQVMRLVRQVSGQAIAAQEAAELARRTGGNPFFVCEYARLPEAERASGEVPVAVRSVLGRRLAGLDPAVLQVLRVAAVMGETLDIDWLSRATRLGRDELADLLDEAADEHVIVAAPGSGGYMFAHALLRDEVTAGMSSLRLQRLHLRIAEAVGPGESTEALVRRASHLVAALPLADAAEVFAACRTAALAAENRYQSEGAARWWGHALEAFDLLADDTVADRDELVIAQVAALARSGRGQTVLEVIDAGMLDAVRRGRLDSAGRMASTLLRTSGSWPWAVYGDDPGPLLARLAGLETLVRAHPAAHISILAALAVGSCYDPDGSVPDALSQRALDLADKLGDDEALADALLGRALTFSGLAERAEESVELLSRLATVPHRTWQIDEVISHGLLHLAKTELGDPEAAEHVRLGALGSDVLRLPTSRVQFRWAAASLSQWRTEDLSQTQALFDEAVALHRETELYQSGVYDVALLTLRWDQGRLHERDALIVANSRLVPWAAAVFATARGDADADDLIAAELARFEPVVWTTHGRLTMLAHLVADRGLRPLVPELVGKLEHLAGCVANFGQVGAAGTVGLALARLHALVGDLDTARRHLDTAFDVSLRAHGVGSLLRCRLLAAQLDHQSGQAVAAERLQAIADDARRRGMAEVERQALALLA